MHDELDDEVSGSFEDYWAVARRRRWWILLPWFLCWAGVWTISWLLPSTYRSEALILVEQPRVPEQYVVPNVTVSLQDRLQSMTQQILSRTRLQATIDRFGLYARRGGVRFFWGPSDPVEQMRNDISIDLVESPGHPGELTAFKIDYTAANPELAQRVNSELTSLFIDENLRSQQQQSESTTAFLQNELQNARTELETQEAKVRAFKANHFGDLPSQLESNVQILTGLQTQLDNNQRALDGAKQQKLYLESLLQQYQTVQASLGGANSSEATPQALDKELFDLRTHLADVRSRYTDDYPDVVSLEKKIRETEALKKEIGDEIASNQKVFRTSGAGTSSAQDDVEYDPSSPIMQVRSQLKSNELEIANDQKRATEIEAQIASYRGRLNLTPETEQELADVSRGYEESKANYNSLLQKQNQSQLATSLEQRQQGQQFRILDPPSAPIKPSSPNHLRLSLVGFALGMAVGICLAAFMQLVDKRIHQESDLEGILVARVLVGIPHLTAPGEDRYLILAKCAEIAAAAAMVLLVLAGNLYAFYKG